MASTMVEETSFRIHSSPDTLYSSLAQHDDFHSALPDSPDIGSPPSLSPTITLANLELFPSPLPPLLPAHFIEDPTDDCTISQWISAFKARQEFYEKERTNLEIQQRKFREGIVSLLEENATYRDSLDRLESDLKAKDGKIKELEAKLNEMSSKSTNQIRLIEDLAEENRSMKRRVRAAESAALEALREKEALQEKVAEKMCGVREKMRRRVGELFGVKDKEVKRQKRIYQSKIEKLQEVLASDPLSSSLPFSTKSHRKSRVWIPEVIPEETLLEEEETKNSSPDVVLKPTGPPVANPRHGCTGNERWIDHRPTGANLDLGTVMKPAIKNSKEVVALKASDFISSSSSKNKNKCSASKYALLHHSASTSGTVKTEIYKGDVIPSSTGGAQIIFNDIETLGQRSPITLGTSDSDTSFNTETRHHPHHPQNKKGTLRNLLKRSRRS